MSRIRSLHLAGALVAAVLCALPGSSGAAPSIGVAGFAGDAPRGPSGVTLAGSLADAIAERDLERVLRPGSFVAEPGIDPSASDVRDWAYSAAVDALILGRVWPRTEERASRLVVVVRSGHSGAERSRHSVDLPGLDRRGPVIDALAEEILIGLGYEPSDADPLGPVESAGPAAATSTPGAGEDRGRGLDTAFDREGFDADAPIEIKADEAEIVSRDHGRDLLFQRNVHVTQANVTLRSQRLEATYKRGESEPEKLVARGDVFVDQGGRQARCDRAVYLRKDQRLTCSGHAELVQGCDIVRGDSIHFWLADDRARVEGAASIVIRPEGEAGVGCRQTGGSS